MQFLRKGFLAAGYLEGQFPRFLSDPVWELGDTSSAAEASCLVGLTDIFETKISSKLMNG